MMSYDVRFPGIEPPTRVSPKQWTVRMDEVFNHWARMDVWSLDEATALSLGLNPVVHQPQDPKDVTQATQDSDYARRRELLLRAIESGNLPLKIPPAEFVYWARERSIELPAALLRSVQQFSKKYSPPQSILEPLRISQRKSEYELYLDRAKWKTLISDTADLNAMKNRLQALANSIHQRDAEIARLSDLLAASSAPEKELTTRERNSVLKLVISMAVGGYGYDHTLARSTQAKEIASDAHRLGLSIDEDTVRKWLKEAAELLDRGGKGQSL